MRDIQGIHCVHSFPFAFCQARELAHSRISSRGIKYLFSWRNVNNTMQYCFMYPMTLLLLLSYFSWACQWYQTIEQWTSSAWMVNPNCLFANFKFLLSVPQSGNILSVISRTASFDIVIQRKRRLIFLSITENSPKKDWMGEAQSLVLFNLWKVW